MNKIRFAVLLASCVMTIVANAISCQANALVSKNIQLIRQVSAQRDEAVAMVERSQQLAREAVMQRNEARREAIQCKAEHGQ